MTLIHRTFRVSPDEVARWVPARAWLVLLMAMTLSAGGCGMTVQQEIDIGRQARPQFEQEFGGLYPDPQVQDYVQHVGESLVEYANRTNLPWEFRVLNSDQINAFALPGGFIYLTQGLLRQLENEAQLASVLGHEIAHVAGRHSVQQLQQAQLIQGGALLAGILSDRPVVADIGQLVGGLALMKYGRDQEREADLDGLKYLAREGYQPQAAVQVMQVLRRASSGAPPEFFASHPSPENREQYLQQRIRSRYARVADTGRTGEAEFRRVMFNR